jgi:streptomycin 3"-adenylyltransferase
VDLTSSARAILGEALVGVYPHGSLMLGGWRRERSDIDVLVVVDRPLTQSEKSLLADGWSEESLPCPAIGLELSVVTSAAISRPPSRPAFELHVTTAPQDRKVIDGDGHPGDLDLVLHFAVARSLGHEGFAEVPEDLVLTRVADELDWAAEHAPSEYAVLNACRAWQYAVDGTLVSKVDGGRWAEQRLSGSDRDLVRAALALQSGDTTAPIDPTVAAAFALRVRDVIRSGRPGDHIV